VLFVEVAPIYPYTMKISISTVVGMPAEKVWEGFNESLFKKLAPPFPLLKLLRFDGNMPSDEVHIELNFLLFKQLWHSRITAQQSNEQEIYFIDEGVKLPFFLKNWVHKHRLIRTANGGTELIDEINYQSPNLIIDWLLYPAMLGQFLYRKPVYRKVFETP
jgi:ligand-binding SRPBCC domain-containing protein